MSNDMFCMIVCVAWIAYLAWSRWLDRKDKE